MLHIRVIVPLKWNSQLRKDLFNKLIELGYTWHSGLSLTKFQDNFQNMSYIAISCTNPIITFSSRTNLIMKTCSDLGFNYMVTNYNVNKIIDTVNYIKKYLENSPSESDLHFLTKSNNTLKDLILLS